MFIGLTWLDIQIGVVRSPIVTGSLLIGIAAVAVVIGIFFQRRTFCRYLCPIGSLNRHILHIFRRRIEIKRL